MTNVVQFRSPPLVKPPVQEWSYSVGTLTSFGTKTTEDDTPRCEG